jgi:hypothetical protein
MSVFVMLRWYHHHQYERPLAKGYTIPVTHLRACANGNTASEDMSL